MDVLSSRILLRPGDLGRSRRFCRDLLALAICREFDPPDDPGLVFFLGQGLLEVFGHAARPARALGDDLDPGPRCARRARNRPIGLLEFEDHLLDRDRERPWGRFKHRWPTCVTVVRANAR